MIKIIAKLFTKPEEIEDSTVEFVIEVPEKTKTELFDEAVKDVVKRKLRNTVEQELIKLCYTPEELALYEEAAEKAQGIYGTLGAGFNNKYCQFTGRHGNGDIYLRKLDFKLPKLIDRIFDKELEDE